MLLQCGRWARAHRVPWRKARLHADRRRLLGAPDRAAFYTVAVSRDLDFMRSCLAPGKTNHPPDNLGAVLAAAESVSGSGRDFILRIGELSHWKSLEYPKVAKECLHGHC